MVMQASRIKSTRVSALDSRWSLPDHRGLSVRRAEALGYFFVVFELVAGALQYVRSAGSFHAQVGSVYWSLGEAALGQAGPERYVKDALLILFGISWPLVYQAVPSALRLKSQRLISGLYYYPLMILLVVLGLMPHVVGWGYPPFLVAGLRWLLLCHDAVGVFLLWRLRLPTHNQEKALLVILAMLLAVDISFMSRQESLFKLSAITGSRIPGMLSVAATNGYFAFACALISWSFRHRERSLQVIVIGLSFAVAFWSGTRFALIGIAGVIASSLWESICSPLTRGRGSPARNLLIFTYLVGSAVLISGVALTLALLGRGNPFDQVSGNGRISNLPYIFDQIKRSSLHEILFGQGLGTGTNSAFEIALRNGIDPLAIKWNIQIDNSVVTLLFQLGVVGSCIVWITMVNIGLAAWRGSARLLVALFVLAAVTQDIFEQNFIVVALAVALACRLKEGAGVGPAPRLDS